VKKWNMASLAPLLFLLLITGASAPLTVEAQWLQVNNGLGNQTVYSLASGGNNIFAGTAANGVYFSTNNGANWTQAGLSGVSIWALAVNGNYIFAGNVNYQNPHGVYLSTNNGTSWTQTSLNDVNVYTFAVSGNKVFAGTFNNDVYVSTDNGTTWTHTIIDYASVFSLAVNGNNIFAGTGYGVYLSTDNGTTWNQTSLDNRWVWSIAVSGNNVYAGTFGDPNSYGVYLSTNSGTTWTQTSLNTQLIFSLAASGNNNVFAGTYALGVYGSNDNGTSSTQRNEGLGNFTVRALCILNNYIYAGTYFYGVYRRPLGELTGIQPISGQFPAHFTLEQNYPNPFNPSTVIKFQVASSSSVKLIVFDVLGREVAALVDEQLKPGTYEVEWNASNYPSGVYFYKLEAGDYTQTKKMLMIK